MIIWLASYPRSGNTFFRVLLNHRFGLKTHSVYDDPDIERLGSAEIVGHERLPDSVDNLRLSVTPYIVKTHELPDAHDGPAIYLVRDGRDALVSFARYLQKVADPPRSIVDKAREAVSDARFRAYLERAVAGDTEYGSWSEHVLRWVRRPRTHVVLYEDLIADPLAVVDRALQAVGAQAMVTDPTPPPAFAELHKQAPTFFRKGRPGAWRDEMTDDLHRRFWERHGGAMHALRYGADGAAALAHAG